MSFELLGDLDWLAVVIAAAAYFVLGAIWYARPVLGKAWMDAGGMQIPAEGQRPGPAIFAVPAAGSLLSAIALGMIAAAGTTSSATWSRRSSSRRSSICDRHGGRKVRQPRRRSRRG